MAEAIARALAPPDVKISSAGSDPSAVHPLALAALGEIDVDGSRQTSKHVSTIPPEDVDVVITLCADEVCPVYLGKARRIHWAMPDPAAITGTDEECFRAFREVRDELRRRLTVVFQR
jgi:arsenate reductase